LALPDLPALLFSTRDPHSTEEEHERPSWEPNAASWESNAQPVPNAKAKQVKVWLVQYWMRRRRTESGQKVITLCAAPLQEEVQPAAVSREFIDPMVGRK
jgi:hypothetical protein